MAASTGHPMVLARNTGTSASPVLEEIAGIGDLSVSQWDLITAQLQTRLYDYTYVLPSLFDIVTVTFNYISGLQISVYNNIKDDFLAKTPRQYVISSGPLDDEDSFGIVLPMLIKSFPWNQPITAVAQHDIVLEGPAYMEEGGIPLEFLAYDDITEFTEGSGS